MWLEAGWICTKGSNLYESEAPSPRRGERSRAARRHCAHGRRDCGYEAALCEDGVAGLRQFFSSHPDVLIVSLEAAELPGWELVERVRSVAKTPIIVCANESNMESLQKGIDLQVDGFLVKPFLRETSLLFAFGPVSEQATGNGDSQNWLYQRNGLKINWRSCEVTCRRSVRGTDGNRVSAAQVPGRTSGLGCCLTTRSSQRSGVPSIRVRRTA